jgi:hypothetical protein
LDEKDSVTTYMVVQDSIENEEILKHSEQNWKMVMEGMKKMIEEKN